jgi:hypothetical protein
MREPQSSREYDNTKDGFIFWLSICNDDMLSMNMMKMLAQTCKLALKLLQKKIAYYKQIRKKWAPVLVHKLIPYLVFKTHPIQYNRSAMKTISALDMVYDYGFNITCACIDLFTEYERTVNQYSFTNIMFRTRKPIEFFVVLTLAGHQIFLDSVALTSYIDTGEITLDLWNTYKNIYGVDSSLYPGRYLVNLRLPTLYNPILLCKRNEDPRRDNSVSIDILMPTNTTKSNDNYVISTVSSIDFIVYHFTHAIIQFKATDKHNYNWDNYVFTFNDGLGDILRASLVQPIDNPKNGLNSTILL